jgi:hypothetical protein
MELALKFAGADFNFRQKLCMAVAAAGSIHKHTRLVSPISFFSLMLLELPLMCHVFRKVIRSLPREWPTAINDLFVLVINPPLIPNLSPPVLR